MTGVRQLWRPRERWVSYGMANYQIERAIRRFEFADPAIGGGRQNELLAAVESAIDEERARWLDVRRAAQKNPSGGEPEDGGDRETTLKGA